MPRIRRSPPPSRPENWRFPNILRRWPLDWRRSCHFTNFWPRR